MNPTEFFYRRFGIAPPMAKTYFEAMSILTGGKPAEIVQNLCPMDYFDLDIITHQEIVRNCFNKSCADCWQNKYKGEKPR